MRFAYPPYLRLIDFSLCCSAPLWLTDLFGIMTIRIFGFARFPGRIKVSFNHFFATMENDIYLYDTERLHGIASDELVKQGLTYFNDNRVIGVALENDRVVAQVEDVNEEQYWLELTAETDGALTVACDCHADSTICVHAIAALYAYADQYTPIETEGLDSAVVEAIQERVKKGRNEVRVKLLSGNLSFGTWQATSLVSATHWQRSYQVQIRSLDQRVNYCTCPDLASNRLGTCKHIEAVLHYAKKQPDYKRLKAEGSPVSFVYLAWESATRPVIRLQRRAEVANDLAGLLAEFFNLSFLDIVNFNT